MSFEIHEGGHGVKGAGGVLLSSPHSDSKLTGVSTWL